MYEFIFAVRVLDAGVFRALFTLQSVRLSNAALKSSKR